jgi:A/G-specific adenine glycosylase
MFFGNSDLVIGYSAFDIELFSSEFPNNQYFNPHLYPMFTEILMRWSPSVPRDMPWKGEKNPYLVWLSEIILQQTRVEQGLTYFNQFKTTYPTVADLAHAPEDEVMKLWEGLGYYSRARNLQAAAKYITHELNGVFPTTYADLLKLKGVGAYSAAAIASFAYNLPYAVLDGNVFRVLSRVFGIATPIDSTAGRKAFSALSQALLDVAQPARYNQNIMDFGATQCTPQSPDCKKCPLQAQCVAFQTQKVGQLPVKEKKITKRTRFFHYFLLKDATNIYIKKRVEKDIWLDLYELPLIETEGVDSVTALTAHPQFQQWMNGEKYTLVSASQPFKQLLTHQTIYAIFYEIHLKAHFLEKKHAWISIKQEDLKKFAFPNIIDRFFKDKSLFLNLF